MTRYFESLETRNLMAATLTAGVLNVTGTRGADVIAVDQNATHIHVQIGETGTRQKFALAQVKTINIFGLEGNDKIGSNDRVTRPGRIDGGAGNDLLVGGRARNLFYGGAGIDCVGYMTRTENLIINLDGKSNDGAAGENDYLANDVEGVMGGKGNDRISGNTKQNALLGGPGNDTLSAGAGDDLIVGGDGDDSLLGGRGTDVIMGSNGFDTLDGGAGSDALAGEVGNDVIRARDGEKDAISGPVGMDVMERDDLLDEMVRPTGSVGVKR